MILRKRIMPPSIPVWHPPPSHCWNLPNFTTVDKYPIRSPLAVADFLANRVAGRHFCEIGTRNGDVMSCVSHHAASVTAIELDAAYCKKLRARGFRVLCKPFENVAQKTPEALSKCNVYFWWPMDAEAQNEKWLKLLLAVHARTETNATIYVAHDTHCKTDMKTLPRLTRQYKGVISRIFYDEGGFLDGEASYQSPFYDRPGRWGVFHLARFLAGPTRVAARAQMETPFMKRIRPATLHAAPDEGLKGFCEATDVEDGLGDCNLGDKGTLALHDTRFGFGDVHSLETCADWCLHFCARCNYVSFSREANDCSWYNRCDLDKLDQNSQAISHHVSRAVVPEGMIESKGRSRSRVQNIGKQL